MEDSLRASAAAEETERSVQLELGLILFIGNKQGFLGLLSARRRCRRVFDWHRDSSRHRLTYISCDTEADANNDKVIGALNVDSDESPQWLSQRHVPYSRPLPRSSHSPGLGLIRSRSFINSVGTSRDYEDIHQLAERLTTHLGPIGRV